MKARQAEIGMRVLCSDPERCREATGTIVAMYPKIPGGKAKPGVRVDEIPAWWPYKGTDRFAPDYSLLTEA